jgi:hypothetical protein
MLFYNCGIVQITGCYTPDFSTLIFVYMKLLLALLFLLLYGCATEAIEMKETPLRLTSIEKVNSYNGKDLALRWQSLDGKINIITIAPLQDSAQYVAGSIYGRCFLKR